MAKKAVVKRVRMSDEQCDAFLKHYAKTHDLKGKEFDHAVKRCAATRWAALERDQKKHAAKPKRAKAKVKPKRAKAKVKPAPAQAA